MKPILNIYDNGVVMHAKFHEGVSSYSRGVISFDTLISMIFSIPSHILVSNVWNLMKLIPSIHDHGVAIHMNVCQDILSNREVIAL